MLTFKEIKEKVDILDIEKEYAPNFDVFNEDDARVHKAKVVVDNALTPTERRILLLYAELQSLRLVGVELGVSTATVKNYIDKIRQVIKDEWDNY